MIMLIDVHKGFKDKKVLRGISFSLKKGEITAFVGPNGVGKTTTIKCICGLNSVDKGEIISSSKNIGVVFDENGLYPNLTAFENLLFFKKMKSNTDMKTTSDIDAILEKVGLTDVKTHKIKTFSKGMKRRLVLARAIIYDPNILILDEPFDGLDITGNYFMINFLKNWVKEDNKERCILFSSHNMGEVTNLCDKIIILNDGKIVEEGSIADILDKNIIGYIIKINKINNLNEFLSALETKWKEVSYFDKTITIRTTEHIGVSVSKLLREFKIDFLEAYPLKSTLEEIYMKEVVKT